MKLTAAIRAEAWLYEEHVVMDHQEGTSGWLERWYQVSWCGKRLPLNAYQLPHWDSTAVCPYCLWIETQIGKSLSAREHCRELLDRLYPGWSPANLKEDGAIQPAQREETK